MKLHYDPEVDALYLRLGDVPIVESDEVRPGVVLDYDAQQRVVGVEFLHVTRQFPQADVKRMLVEMSPAT